MPDENNIQPLQDANNTADKLSTSVSSLNKTINGLQDSQKKLSDTFQDSSKVFKDNFSSIQDIGIALKKTNQVFDENAKVLNLSNGLMAQNKAQLNSLLEQYGNLNKQVGDHGKSIDNLNNRIGQLSITIADQEKKLIKSRDTFDFHAKSIDALKSSFDKIKGAAGDFAPQLESVTKGFNTMKSGLSVVKEGFKNVGGAIKATGFGLLVLVLQSLTEWLSKSTEGQKVLHGALNAVGKITAIINKAMMDLGGAIFHSLIHPVDTIKAAWNDVTDTLAKQFKPIGKMLHGLVHLDFGEMKDGFGELTKNVKGITKSIVETFNQAKKGVTDLINTGVKAYKDGYNEPAKKTGTVKSYNTKSQKKALNGRQDLSPATSAGIAQENREEQLLNFKKNTDEEFKIAQENQARIVKNKQESDEKQKASEKARVTAQKALQDKYLEAVTKTTSAVMAIFGKNTVAAKAAFKAHQAAAAAEVIINTKRSIMSIWSADSAIPFVGVPKAIAETAIVAAVGASNLAAILKQKPGFAKGGQFISDGRGAVLSGYSHTDNTNAYLRSGEAIVVSEAMRNPWARNLVSAINVAHGGRDFSMPNPGRGYAIGGIFTDGGNANRYYNQPMNDQRDLANTLAYQMINNFPPIYVDVKDVNNQQNILAQTVNRVNL